MVFKIACNAFIQVDTIASEHIMAVARIHKEIGLGPGINAGTEETDAVLRDTSGVIGANDHFQASFQISGSQLSGWRSCSLRVGLWSIHVAFAVHYFVVSPVDDRAAGYSYFE